MRRSCGVNCAMVALALIATLVVSHETFWRSGEHVCRRQIKSVEAAGVPFEGRKMARELTVSSLCLTYAQARL